MWWFFKKVFENDDEIEYAYSRESKGLYGVVRFRKSNMRIINSVFDKNDSQNGFDAAVEWARMIISKENSPDERLIVCG
jgi:hypothetical protein